MKVLLICPRFPDSLWSFSGVTEIVGVKSAQSPLGLATVAALTPGDWAVEIKDENIEAIDFDAPADVVGIAMFNVQYRRALEIACEFKKRGRHVVVGGPYPTLCPERCLGHFDTVFQGEVEYTWPEFCRDFARGVKKAHYNQVDRVDIVKSPTPRNDLLDVEKYLYFYIQTTRGCPFTCEFCDIIVTDGRRPRTKMIEQVVAEVEAIHVAGGRYVSFSDANLIGDPRYAKRLLTALRDWGLSHRFPIRFGCELTINVADMPDILDLLQQANFDFVFLGIESPRLESLRSASKQVNIRGQGSLVDKIRRIQSRNLMIIAGMIVGFDTDDKEIFKDQFEFLLEAGIPFTTSGILFAIEKTPLFDRLKAAGRLFEAEQTAVQVHGSADLNFVPKLMSIAELKAGYNWMIRQHYGYQNYRKRLVRAVRDWQKSKDPAVKSAGRMNALLLRRGLKIMIHYLMSPRKKRRFFFGTLRDVVRTGFTFQKLVVTLSFLLLHKHFHEFVEHTHGDPETVTDAIVWPKGAAAVAAPVP
ncbi:MAG TPA: radical SAM protein [Candidatus Methylomirabilis sp.]|nr:radical SAM protein [Candidatus Methylomirabilis sp.]